MDDRSQINADDGITGRSHSSMMTRNVAQPELKDTPVTSANAAKRDEQAAETHSYIAYATDMKNDTQTAATRKWLEGIVKDKSKLFERRGFPWEPEEVPNDELQKLYDEGRWDEGIDSYEKPYAWSHLILDQAGFELIKAKKEWIETIELESNLKVVGMSPLGDLRHTSHESLHSRKAEWGDWAKQENAASDLTQNSNYEGGKLNDLKDFVFEKRAGEGTLVYVVDRGVQVDVRDDKSNKLFSGFEDVNDRFTILETRAFSNQNAAHDKRTDYADGHGTKVASKVVGQWGTAKGATLVPVQVLVDEFADLPDGFNQVWKDLRRRKAQNRGQSIQAVVVCSVHVVPSQGGWTRQEAEAQFVGRMFSKWIKLLHEEGVPIVLASGNFGDIDKRDVIDTLPAVLATDDVPLINVGATTVEGKAWEKSQGQGSQDGTQLAIYAPGVDVVVHDHIDGKETRATGTSMAAPAVAGIIAVHMNYQPWGKDNTGLARVKEIRRWIQTPESSWERIKNQFPDKPNMKVNMIWNGADEAAHKSVSDSASNSPPPPPQVQNERQTFVVGLEQVGIPRCTTYTPSGTNTKPTTICTEAHDYMYRHFFYRLDRVDDVDSLCTSTLIDFHQDQLGPVGDVKLLENPVWPRGEWKFNLYGEQFTYNNDGSNPGALWKGNRKIDCNGDLEHHDPKSDEWCENNLTKTSGSSRKRRRLLACKW
ncbi:hypothetical protein HBH70_097240 [Parastagonospora nodorum]|nr:hypothetical protein HBH46_105360 [Parastagonospora nodorum]KAH4852073.1 hypothetical protein HBH75_118050 [Parastagonospora nodorum]KAH5037451.1 hypothetical protein HBI75_071860 [Parastagonospora nodorum]KAH5074593.1 hypothetical protein HBH95_143620 [Parastagonospora nodorum]KAH5138840.1 hypothetical protein HBH70_097240 [Parastagonospora nodorum]